MTNTASSKVTLESDTVDDDAFPRTEDDLDAMITRRIVQFHQALVARGQIRPIPLDPKDRIPIQS